MKPKVICFPIHETSWGTMFKIALLLKETQIYDPVMLLTDTVSHHASLCQKQKIDTVLLNDPNILLPDENTIFINHSLQKSHASKFNFNQTCYKYGKKIYRFFQKKIIDMENLSHQKILMFSLYNIVRAVVEIVYLKTYDLKIKALLNKTKPIAIFLYTDNQGGVFAYLAKECMKRGIKIIIPPAAFQHPDVPAKRRVPLTYLRYERARSTLVNCLLKRYLPNQFYKYNDVDVLFYPPWEILAMYYLQILPPFPWARGRNFSNIVCVEDYYQKERCVKSGLEESQIIVSGHIECDNMWTTENMNTKENFIKKFDFDKDKKVIIIALPQLKEHSVVNTWAEHWKEIDFLISIALKSKNNVLLALHPKMEKKKYAFLEKKYACRVNYGQTSDVIPFGDIYITAGSSTVYWAITAGIIVMNVGFYGYSLEHFSYLKSVMQVYDRKKFSGVLNSLINCKKAYERQKLLVEEDRKKYFLPLDGKNHLRILAGLGSS